MTDWTFSEKDTIRLFDGARFVEIKDGMDLVALVFVAAKGNRADFTNARKIAAAPKLLEALKNLRDSPDIDSPMLDAADTVITEAGG